MLVERSIRFLGLGLLLGFMACESPEDASHHASTGLVDTTSATTTPDSLAHTPFIGPPIDINALKKEPWLDVTSGVVGSETLAELCSVPPHGFFGYYFLIDTELRHGPIGKLTIYKAKKNGPWRSDDTDEDFVRMETTSDRFKAWGHIGIGSPKGKVLDFVGQRVHSEKGQILFATIADYQCEFQLRNDTVRSMVIKRDCASLDQRSSTGKVSSTFNTLLAECYPDMLIRNDSLVMQGEAIPFPEDPPSGISVTLTARQDSLSIALIVHRLTLTSISYRLKMMKPGSGSHQEEGIAELNPLFHLGSEVDESSISGISYLADEFVNEQENGCHTVIRLGRDPESGPFLLGKLIKNCNGKLKEITLDNYPTLIEK